MSSIRSCYCCSCYYCCYCCCCYCFKSSSLVVVRRLFVPAKCVRINKLCKTHYKCYYTTIKHAPVFYTPHYPSSYPSKKNNYFLSTSHLVYPFQKSVVLCCWRLHLSTIYVDNTMQCQKKKSTPPMVWSYMYFWR